MNGLTVALRLNYADSCPACHADAEQTIAAAVRDRQVSSITLMRAKRCQHQTLPGLGAAGEGPDNAAVSGPAQPALSANAEAVPTPPTPPPTPMPGGFDHHDGGQPALLELPHSDTNGFDAGEYLDN